MQRDSLMIDRRGPAAMDPWLSGLLVLFHVLFAALWVGGGVFQVLMIGPTLKQAGPLAGGFMSTLARRGGIGKYFAINGALTIVFGAILYSTSGVHKAAFSGGNLYITLGAIVAVAAFVHGMLVNFPTEKKWIAFASNLKGPPTAAEAAQLQEFGMKLGKAGTIGVAMVFLAFLLMLMRNVAV